MRADRRQICRRWQFEVGAVRENQEHRHGGTHLAAKGKDHPVTRHMRVHRESGGVAPLILNLFTRWLVVKPRPRPIYSPPRVRKKYPVPIAQDALWAPGAGLDGREKEKKIVCPDRSSNPGPPILQPVATSTELSKRTLYFTFFFGKRATQKRFACWVTRAKMQYRCIKTNTYTHAHTYLLHGAESFLRN